MACHRFLPLLERVAAQAPEVSRIVRADEIAATAVQATGGRPELSQPDPAGTANIQFTSGTTGAEGLCAVPSLLDSARREPGRRFPLPRAGDIMLTAQPFHYIDPQWNVVAGLLAGATLVILDGFHPSSFWGRYASIR